MVIHKAVPDDTSPWETRRDRGADGSAGTALGGTWTKPLFLGNIIWVPTCQYDPVLGFQWADGPQDGAGVAWQGTFCLSMQINSYPTTNTTEQQHMRRR